jgi:nitrous oxidase accessory protein NosD
MRPLVCFAVLLCVLLAAVACGEGNEQEATYRTLRVPDDYPGIQSAVDGAEAGDLVLIKPGVYRESVEVETENLTIRGLDRNDVILDGEFEQDEGFRVLADGVAIENITARHYRGSGFFWVGVTGYRGSYLTAHNNGNYGIYALDSVSGQFDHSYASGSPSAGFYIGQCFPCDAAMTDVVSEFNGLGYSGTNAGGNLIVARSVFRNNRAGIVPNSGSYELCYPQRETTFAGNLVYANDEPNAPTNSTADDAFGIGIALLGGVGNVVVNNRVFDHERHGIALAPFRESNPRDDVPSDNDLTRPCAEVQLDPDPTPVDLPAPLYWQAKANRIIGNVVEDSAGSDLALGAIDADVSTLGNCFEGNEFTTSAPLDIETLAPCEGTGTGDWSAGALDLESWYEDVGPPDFDYKDVPPPPHQSNMPDAAGAPPRPAIDVPVVIDVESITVPARPES